MKELFSLPPVRRIQRICAILNRARTRTPVRVLAAKLEVSEKTIDRDLAFMRDQLGLPIVGCHDGHWLAEKVELCPCCAGRIGKRKP